MEIINNCKPSPGHKQDTAGTFARNIYLGIVLILAGIVWMLYNLDFIGRECFRYIFSWQTLLIAAGGYLMAVRKWTAGAVTAGVGVFFAVTDWLDINIPVGEIVLPAILIAVGLAVLLQRRV